MSRRRSGGWAALAAAAAIGLPVVPTGPAAAYAGTTERASVSGSGAQGDSTSEAPAVSADGRFVAFQSFASNLVPGDTNGTADVFVRDRLEGRTERVNVSSDGQQANSQSIGAVSISADGRFVAFESFASNLVASDTNSTKDVFVRDRELGATVRASVDGLGNEAHRFGRSAKPAISADGRVVAFESEAANLVVGDTNAAIDVFVHDLVTRATERVSVDSVGAQALTESRSPAISADGSVVAFESDAPNLVLADTNATTDVFVRDRAAGRTERASVAGDGAQGDGASRDPALSGGGTVVAFESEAPNLVPGDTNLRTDVFVRDQAAGATERSSLYTSGAEAYRWGSLNPTLSADGRFVAFETADALVTGDTNVQVDVFVRDRLTASTSRESVDSNGAQSTSTVLGSGVLVTESAISADGTTVVFTSRSGDFVADDTNGYLDVFVHDFHPATIGPPEVAGLAPAQGTIYGGTRVTLTGRHFFRTRDVRFGGVPALYFVVDVDDRLTAWAPEHPPGTVDVTVTNPDGTSHPSPTTRFTFRTPPAVSAVSPAEGPTEGGTTVVVTGSGLTGATAVRFGGTPAASFVVDSDTLLTAVTPARPAGVVDVVVEAPWGASEPSAAARFAFRAPPVVSAVSPAEGPTTGGTTVVITGSGLTGATAVRFGDVPASSFVVDSDARITALSPPHAPAPAAVVVATSGGTSAPGAAFTFVARPLVSGLEPTRGPASGGTTVVLTGSGFSRASSVRFGDVLAASFVVDSDNQITVVSPAHAKGSVHVSVTSVGGTSATSDADVFTYFGK